MKKINFEIKVTYRKDKIANAWIIYSSKYDISAYGKTKQKAKKMFDAVLTEILKSSKPY